MAKTKRRAPTPPPESESESEAPSVSVSASNIKTELDEQEEAFSQSQSFGASVGTSNDNDDDDDNDEEEDSEDNNDEKNSDKDSEGSYVSDDDAPLPPRQAFKSAPPRPLFKSAILPPAHLLAAAGSSQTGAAKPSDIKADPSSSSSEDEEESKNDDDDDSSSSSSSEEDSSSDDDSDSDGEENSSKSASAKPSSPKTQGAAAAASTKPGGSDSSDSEDNSDSSSSDSDSDSDPESGSDAEADSKEGEEEVAVAADVKTEEPAEDPSVSDEGADDTIVTAPEHATAEEQVESSDDDIEDIPGTLPPGTLPDLRADPDVNMVDAPEAAEEADEAEQQVEQEEPPAEPTPTEEEPEQPSEETPPEPEPEATPEPTRAPRQRSKRQKAKAPFISIQEPEAVEEEASNDEPAAEAEDAPATQEVAATPEEPPATKSPRKRKRQAAESVEDESAENPVTPAPRSAKKQAVAKTPASRVMAVSSSAGGSSSRRGPQGNFEPAEVELLKRTAEKYMEENQMSQADFNELVHDNAQKNTAFWDFMMLDFHDKKRMQVILRCRRIYHNFKQVYYWNEEQDAELAELVDKHGHKWSVIAAAMDRSSEDVRKRWSERVACGDKVILSYWRFDEEKRLGQIVGQLLREIQSSRNQDTSSLQPSAVRDIPWSVVSERMDHTRTARQCRRKWRLIHEAYHFNADGDFVGPPDPAELSNSQIKAERLYGQILTGTLPTPTPSKKKAKGMIDDDTETPSSKKVHLPLLGITPEEDGRTVPETARRINDKTREEVRKMTTEDKHRLVLSIRESNVGREDKIPWTRIVDAYYRKKYGRATRELVWSRLKRTVPNYHRKSVRQICQALIKEYDANAAVGQAWDMDFDAEPADGPEAVAFEEEGEEEEQEEVAEEDKSDSAVPSSGAVVRAMAAAKGGKSKAANSNRPAGKAAAKAPKSAEIVVESDDSDVGAGANAEPSGSQSSTGEAVEALAQRRPTRKGRAVKVNGNTEKHVSESEAEEAPAEQTNGATGRRRAARLANTASVKAKKAKELTDIYSDIEGASNPSQSQPNTQPDDEDIEDVDDDEDTGRRARAASVDLSMGDKQQSEGGEEASKEAAEGDGELPLTLSLSPGLARHKPTARNRPLNVSKQRRDDGLPEVNGTTQGSRFRAVNANAAFASPTSKTTPKKPGEVRRTKKRSLTSAQWVPDTGSDGEGGDVGAATTSIADDIEDVSDHDHANGPANAGESLTARAARAALSFLPRAKRARQE